MILVVSGYRPMPTRLVGIAGSFAKQSSHLTINAINIVEMLVDNVKCSTFIVVFERLWAPSIRLCSHSDSPMLKKGTSHCDTALRGNPNNSGACS